MVYLSQIGLDAHARATGRALADLYALHQLVYGAFAAYEPSTLGRVLFRLDTDNTGDASLLVQSEQEPDWERLNEKTNCVRGPKVWEPQFEAGQQLRFRLRASPTKRIPFPRGHPKAGHQRLGLLTRPEQEHWLSRQGERCGFALCATPAGWFNPFDEEEPQAAVQIVSLGHLKGYKQNPATKGITTVTHLAVDFDGVLRVTDPTAFSSAVANGIGTGKGFGFGLLSVSRLK
ncbi:MAG: type I-E CRISPR-associated protein Cas6/Cse3/CasE [Janthinobacterium lividum]